MTLFGPRCARQIYVEAAESRGQALGRAASASTRHVAERRLFIQKTQFKGRYSDTAFPGCGLVYRSLGMRQSARGESESVILGPSGTQLRLYWDWRKRLQKVLWVASMTSDECTPLNAMRASERILSSDAPFAR